MTQKRLSKAAILAFAAVAALLATPAWAQVCSSTPDLTPPLPITPLDRDVSVTANLQIAQDGAITAAHLLQGSGNDSRDADLMAHVEKNWLYRPMRKGCNNAYERVVIHYLHVSCVPQPLPGTQTSPDDVDVQDRPRSTDLRIGVAPDGRVTDAAVSRSSGDAKLDAAAVAHVKEAWRWQPYACKDPGGAPVRSVNGTATVSFDYAVPDPPEPAPR